MLNDVKMPPKWEPIIEYFNLKSLSGAPKGRKVSIVKALRWGSERKKGDPKKRLLYRSCQGPGAECQGPGAELAAIARGIQIIKIEYKLAEEKQLIGRTADAR